LIDTKRAQIPVIVFIRCFTDRIINGYGKLEWTER